MTFSELPASAGVLDPGGRAHVIGDCVAFRQLLRLVERVAPTNHPLLLNGPTGCGKEVIAQLIHQCGIQGSAPFIDINCGAIPEQLVESELFGHVRGAFTGASADRCGHFQTAGNGTLFLDEIGELPLALQPKLLRVLETRSFRPVGASSNRPFTGRIIAATHRKLPEMVRQGRFREDLYYRLAVFLVDIPGLDQRQDDIPILARHFAAQLPKPLKFSQAALAMLRHHPWPGHVRELRNLIHRIGILADGPDIDADMLAHFLDGAAIRPGLQTELADQLLLLPGSNKLEAAEHLLIDRALALSNGSKTGAALRLGVNRKVVERRLQARDQRRAQATGYAISAQALVERSAFGEAAGLLEQALQLLGPDTGDREQRRTRFEWHRLLAVCYRGLHGWLSARAQAEQEAALQAGSGVVDPAALNLLLFGIWTAQLMTMQLGSARATAHDMLERARATGDTAAQAEAHVVMANTMFWFGDSGEVLACLERSRLPGSHETAFTGPQGFDLPGLALTFDGLASFQLGDFARAGGARLRLEVRARVEGAAAFDRALALQGAAWLACLQEDYPAMGVLAEQLETLSREHEFSFYRGIGQVFRGCCLGAQGETDAALVAMADGYEIHVLRHGGKLFHSFQAWKRGEVLLAAGRPDECATLIAVALEIALEHNERAYLPELMCTAGLARLKLGDPDGAEEDLRAALSTALALGSIPGRARAASLLAEQLLLQGRRRQAVTVLDKAVGKLACAVSFPGLDRARRLLQQLSGPASSAVIIEELDRGIHA
jgi:transcriptional regulator with AAA-type ATPase domain